MKELIEMKKVKSIGGISDCLKDRSVGKIIYMRGISFEGQGCVYSIGEDVNVPSKGGVHLLICFY